MRPLLYERLIMNLKQKFTTAKKKIEENRVVTDALIIVGCVATTAISIYVSRQVDATRKVVAEAQNDMTMADAIIRDIYDNAKHVRETGHSVTFFNGKGDPLFVMNAPTED
jgi:hypothetical protein